MRRLALCALGVAALLATGTGCAREPPARRAARQLYARGLDHRVRLRYDSAAQAFREAILADPAYMPAVSEYLAVTSPVSSAHALDTLIAIAQRVPDGPLGDCLQRIAGESRGIALPRRLPREASAEARLCHAYHEHLLASGFRGTAAATRAAVAAAFPEDRRVIWTRLSALQHEGRLAEYVHLAHRLLGTEHPAWLRMSVRAALAVVEHERGNDAVALAIERDARRDPAWRFAGARYEWAAASLSHARLEAGDVGARPGMARHVAAIYAESESLILEAATHGDVRARYFLLMESAERRLDRGRLDLAVNDLERMRPMVDSVADPVHRAYHRMRLGRAYIKRGQAREGEAQLLDARRLLGSRRQPLTQKEIEHNLLHAYEATGRDAEAASAGAAFVRFAEDGGLHPVRMMSYRDMGIFHRLRGRHDLGVRFMERMTADVDSLRDYWYFAGEYRELAGDLEAAQRYYARAKDTPVESSRALGGLVRVAMAMGDTAAARHHAREHDAARLLPGRPESPPLLPGVLARLGDTTSARAAFAAARAETRHQGQMAAWADLTNDLAALELRAEHAHLAALLADSAAQAATRVAAAEIALRARALATAAKVRTSGDQRHRALTELHALALGEAPSAAVLLRAEIYSLAAAATTRAGDWRAALSWYARAAGPLDSAAAAMSLDVQQAAFRSAQRRVYDEALVTIAAHAASAAAPAAWAAWSSRRKGRAYAVALPRSARPDKAAPAPDVALIDYVLTDTAVFALVVRGDRRSLVRLPGDAPTITTDVRALHRAADVRVGSAVDRRFARYSVDLAHRLYRQLLAPLEPLVGGAPRLLVVPDGILGLVPFDALVTALPPPESGDEGARFVLDDRTVAMATSMQGQPASLRVPSGQWALVVAPDAPGADGEADAAVRALGRATQVLRGAGATRAAVLGALPHAGLVHYAGHAVAHERDPAASHLQLAPGTEDDGRLSAGDIAALRLSGPLVVLSACATANGRVLDGEGVLSVSRSFLRAGARATVATLWPVGASASTFAGAFLSTARTSGDAADALRAAKLAMRQQGYAAWAWAPYQLIAAPSAEAPGAAAAR